MFDTKSKVARMAVAGDPIGEFDALVAGDVTVDRHQLFARLRAERPIFFSDRLQAWVLTRYDDVQRVLKDEETFLTLVEGPGAPVFGRSLLQWRGREHNKKAGPVVKRIRSPRAFTEGLDDMVRRVTVTVADQLPLEVAIDLKQSYTMWMPLLVITELLDIHEGQRFRSWYHAMAQGGVTSISNPHLRDEAFAARAQLREMLEPIVEERRRSPGADLVSDLAVAHYDGEPFPFEEIVATVTFLLTAGVETTERVLASLFSYLTLDPRQCAVVRERREDATFLQSLSAEALRCFPPVSGLTRAAATESRLHDTDIASGDRLVLFLASANRDEDHFDRSQAFEAERWVDDPQRQFVSGGKILPFGAGRHHCAGSRLAATEMVHAIQELAERVGSLEADGALPPAEGLMLTSPPRLPVILHAA